jgi:hypothetical protein
MREPISRRLGGAMGEARLRLVVLLVQTKLRSFLVSLNFLDGFKTYIVAAAMVVAALAQLLGVALPSFDGHSSGQLLMEGLAILFLRKGVKG